MQVHEKISLLRKVKGWTQEQMAERLEMSLHGYANIERGETDVQFSRLEQISQILSIELKDLLDFDDKSVFMNNIASPNSHNYINSSAKNLEHELEKASLIIAQQNNEIENLKQQISQLQEINALLKK